MRTLNYLALALLAGCNWMTFDDLANTTWVDSTNKPDVKSSDWGVAIAAGQHVTSTTGGVLTVIGAGEPVYSQLDYSAQGKSSLATNSFRLGAAVGIVTLDTQPILITDPTSDTVAIVGSTGGGQVAAVKADASYVQIFGPTNADAGTYMLTAALAEAPLVGAADSVYSGAVAQTCKLVDSGATAVAIRAMSAIRNAALNDDVLVWSGDGQLLRYPNSIYAGCAGTQAALSAQPIAFQPGKGSQIIPIDARYYLLEGHKDGADDSFLAVVDGTTLAVVGTPVTEGKQRSATVLAVGDKLYAVAGYPTATVDGTSCGVAIVYEITRDSTGALTGITAAPVTTLHDAQPADGQSFGRGIAVMQFNGQGVLAVAADNEIFLYFQTLMYGETRTGK